MTPHNALTTAPAEQPAPNLTVSEVLAPAAGGPGGPPLPKPSRLPKGGRGRSKALRILIPLAAVLVAGGVVAAWFVWFRGPQVRTDLVTAKVEHKDLQLKVVERGTLEAKENRDIKCEVKTGSRGAPKIKWVVDNGAFVKPGDPLVVIDDSYLQEQALAKKIDRDKAEADKIAAEQTYPVKKSSIKLAEQNLEKWVKGDFPQQLHDLEGQIQTSESAVLQQEDRAAWAARMVKKGYMTPSQLEAEEANLNGDRLALQKLQEQKKVLLTYSDPVNRETFGNAIKQAQVDERTALATKESTLAVFRQQEELYKDLQEQIAQCKIAAQYAGIVVYAVPEQTRTGSGSTQSIIAQGEPVQYGQKMMSIPDLSHMLVNLRVHEAFINHMKDGLPATVRVDAASGRTLKAHVKSVANVAAPQDWMSPDVKVYQSYVEIEDSVEDLKLKPGLSAVCTIYTEAKAEHVLAVPVQAVLSPLERGGKPRCFVMTPIGPEARDVELGLTDEKYVEIKGGLKEGEDVILNPRSALSDKEKKATKEDEKIVPTGGKPGAGKGRPEGGRGGRGGRPDATGTGQPDSADPGTGTGGGNGGRIGTGGGIGPGGGQRQ
jgi:multidrug efflux pump subunit AcrA (membrane-fusion protein)